MNYPNTVRNIIFILVYVISGLALLIIIDGLISGNELAPINVAIGDMLRPLRSPALTSFFLSITNIGSPITLSIISTFIAIVLILRHDTYDALLYIVSIAIALFSFVILKNSFTLPRPEGGLIGLSGWSFPSGHATVATAFFFATAYTFYDSFKSTAQKFFLVLLSVIGTLLICLSRLYLGAHWALDVLAGIALGFMCVSFTVLLFNFFIAKKSQKTRRKKNVLH